MTASSAHVSSAHDISTPPGAEKKKQRIQSPIIDTDAVPSVPDIIAVNARRIILKRDGNVPEDDDVECLGSANAAPSTARTAPVTAESPTLSAMRILMREELQPITTSVVALEKKCQDLTLSVSQRLESIEARIDKSELRIAMRPC